MLQREKCLRHDSQLVWVWWGLIAAETVLRMLLSSYWRGAFLQCKKMGGSGDCSALGGCLGKLKLAERAGLAHPKFGVTFLKGGSD